MSLYRLLQPKQMVTRGPIFISVSIGSAFYSIVRHRTKGQQMGKGNIYGYFHGSTLQKWEHLASPQRLHAYFMSRASQKFFLFCIFFRFIPAERRTNRGKMLSWQTLNIVIHCRLAQLWPRSSDFLIESSSVGMHLHFILEVFCSNSGRLPVDMLLVSVFF